MSVSPIFSRGFDAGYRPNAVNGRDFETGIHIYGYSLYPGPPEG